VMTVKQAISDMRDVLNNVWKNLVGVGKRKTPGRFRSSISKEFKKPESRRNLAECLMTESLNIAKFQKLLDNMYDLYREMSVSDVGKNPLNDDQIQLDDLYPRWIIQIDGVVGMIN